MANFVRVAACHASPVFLNARKTTDKAISLIKEAASRHAQLVVFPETYIAAFPVWSAVRPPTENHSLFQRMVQQSVFADGDELNAVRETARSCGVVVSIGFSERSRNSNACLYNSNVTIGPEGETLVHHRKLMPTFFEKLVWSPGDGHGLRVADTKHGRIGALICGENTNALARYSLIAQAEQIHISTWPAIWPTRVPGATKQATADVGNPNPAKTITRSSTNYDNLAANRTRAAAHCFEAKVFGVACSGHLGDDAVQAIVDGANSPEVVSHTLQEMPRAATFFLDPTGAPLPSFVFKHEGNSEVVETIDSLQNDEGILYADMNLEECIEGKQYHDVVGGYQRLDVFDLRVNRTRRDLVRFVEDNQAEVQA